MIYTHCHEAGLQLRARCPQHDNLQPPRTHPGRMFFVLFFAHFYFSASGQAMVTGVVPSPSRFLRSIFIAHRFQQSHCWSNFHRVLLAHAPAYSASQFVRNKKSPRIYTSMHSGGLELAKLTYTRLEDNLVLHWGDRDVPHVEHIRYLYR